jgi:hypothetical protein
MDLDRDSELALLPVAGERPRTCSFRSSHAFLCLSGPNADQARAVLEYIENNYASSPQDVDPITSGFGNAIDNRFVPPPSVNQRDNYTSRGPLPIRVEGGFAYYGFFRV